MIIELYQEISWDRQKTKTISLNIDENLSIRELINEIHEITGISKSVKMEWNEKVEEFACRYYFKNGDDFEYFNDFERIQNFDEQICNFPRFGKKNALILYFYNSVGFAN